jgi:Fic family protein
MAAEQTAANTRKYMDLTKTSRATAYRKLADLVNKVCLQPSGKDGRSSAYVIVIRRGKPVN